MNVKFYSFLFAVAALAVSCNVDESYDISDVKTDNIVIGSDESVFDIPVATIVFTGDDLDGFTSSSSSGSELMASASRSTETTGFTEIMNQVQIFLPSDYEVDAEALSGDDSDAEVDELVGALTSELSSNSSKRDELADMLYENKDNSDYDDVFEVLGVDSSSDFSVSDLSSAIKTTVNDDEGLAYLSDLLKGVVTENIVNLLGDYMEINIEQALGVVDIPSDVVDILNDNIDGDTNKLSVIATYEHNMPFNFTLSPITISNGQVISFEPTVIGADYAPEDVVVDEFVDVLSSGDGATLGLDLNLTSLVSMSGGDGYFLKIKLALRKTGTIKLDM